MDELLAQFLIEAPELAAQAGADLLALEDQPDNSALIDSAFRAIHTLKGSAGLFDLKPMEDLLHASEDLMGDIRKGTIPVTSVVVGALLRAVGQSDAWLTIIAREQRLPPEAAAVSKAIKDQLSAVRQRDFETIPAGGAQIVRVVYTPDPDAYFRGDDPLAIARAAPGLTSLHVSAEGSADESYDPYRCTLRIEATYTAPEADIRNAFRLVADQVDVTAGIATPTAVEAVEESGQTRHIRVDTRRLDALSARVEDLVVAKAGIAKLLADADRLDVTAVTARLREHSDDLDRLIAGLQREVTQARLTPLEPVFRRLQRSVRDIASEVAKDVQFVVEGGDIELDKTIVDGLYVPLLHVLRNAVDHGIESRDERAVSAKPARARMVLTAARRGNAVAVEVSDDGRGIDPARMREAAVAKGLISRAAADELSDDEAQALIFRPGFSTARAITTISGRGVGMDAARTAISHLGGEVTLSSRAGTGTTVTFLLPLTLLLTPLMVVGCGTDRFALPLDDVVETIRMPSERVQSVRMGRASTLRGRALPLVRLADLLGRPPAPPAPNLTIVVVRAGGETIGVEVDEIGQKFEAVLRPMRGLLAEIPGMAGTTLQGDGSLLVVLDMPELIG